MSATTGFTCPFCHLVFALRAEFEHHVSDEHPDRRPQAPTPEAPTRAPDAPIPL